MDKQPIVGKSFGRKNKKPLQEDSAQHHRLMSHKPLYERQFLQPVFEGDAVVDEKIYDDAGFGADDGCRRRAEQLQIDGQQLEDAELNDESRAAGSEDGEDARAADQSKQFVHCTILLYY